MKEIVLFLVLNAATSFAWSTVQEFECAMTNALIQDSAMIDATFTNQLNQYISSPLDNDTLLEAKLVFSIVSLKLFKEQMEEQLLETGFTTVSNLMSSVWSDTEKWQCWSSAFITAGYYAFKADYHSSFCLSTNILQRMTQTSFDDSTNIVSKAILKCFDMHDLTMRNAVKATAGMSAAMVKDETAALFYINSLPSRYRGLVQEALASP